MPRTALTRTAYVIAVEAQDKTSAIMAACARGGTVPSAEAIMSARRASGTFATLQIEGFATPVQIRVTEAEAMKLRDISRPVKMRIVVEE